MTESDIVPAFNVFIHGLKKLTAGGHAIGGWRWHPAGQNQGHPYR
jgi:hypothetical protein